MMDSNHRKMTGSKPVALPLGEFPKFVFGGESWIRTKCPEGTDLQSAAVANAAHSPKILTLSAMLLLTVAR